MAPQTLNAKSNTAIGNTNTVPATRKLLLVWKHFIQDLPAKTKYHDFLEETTKMITGDHLSAMSASSVASIQQVYEDSKDTNESTFLVQFWLAVTKKNRLVKPANPGEPPIERKWSDDLFSYFSKDFRSDCLQAITESDEHNKLLRDTGAPMPVPKPDIIYGARALPDKWFTQRLLAVISLLGRFAMACDGLVCPWFLVEAKAFGGDLEESVVQAARGCAVLIATFRRLDALAGTVFTGDGVDKRSYVFSLCLSPTSAKISVHYMELQGGKVIAYHMHHLTRYAVDEPDNWATFRHDVNNVLEFGLMEKRKGTVMAILEAIAAKGEGVLKRSAELEEAENATRYKKPKTDATSSSASPSAKGGKGK